MKKILLTFSLLVMLITVACDTSKNSSTTSVTPVASTQQPQVPAKPQKGEMKESDMQAVEAKPYEKKAFPPKGQMRPMAATPVPDTIK